MTIFTIIFICILIFGLLSVMIGFFTGIIALIFKLIFWVIPIIFVAAMFLGIPVLIIVVIIKFLR